MLVFVLLCVCIFLSADRFGQYVSADPQSSCVSDTGITIVPVQLSRESYGLAMFDSINQNMCIYRLNDRGTVQSRLQLYAARSFKYDRLLEQYNTDEPKPQQIKMMLENLASKNPVPLESISEPQEPNSEKKDVKDANQADEEQLKGW